MFSRRQVFFESDIDQFLNDFDKKNLQRSQSQQETLKKHARIFRLRDEVVEDEAKGFLD